MDGLCGSSTVNAMVLPCVPLESCQKDVKVHLKALDVRKSPGNEVDFVEFKIDDDDDDDDLLL